MRSLRACIAISLLACAPAAAQLAWTQLAPITSPTARSGHKLAFHPTRQRLVLFGGQSASGTFLDDTWEFDGTTWRQIALSLRPTPRADHTLVYDPTRDALLLFGGRGTTTLGDIWAYSAQGRWSRMLVTGAVPPPRAGHFAFSDPVGGMFSVLAGADGSTTFADQYVLDSNNVWRQVVAQVVPRVSGGLAVDVHRGVVLLSGGTANGRLLADTWQWANGRWAQVSPDNNVAVVGIDLVYDEVRQRTLYFGGTTQAASLSATHAEFASGTWSLLGIARPPARAHAALAFDPNLGKVVMFGGTGAAGPLADTWTLGSRLPAEVTLFGPPCGASLPGLDVAAIGERPWIGADIGLRLTNLPSRGAVALFLGGSATSWQGLPLPVSLGALGRPECQVHVSFDVQVDMRLNQNEALATLAIPPSIALNGALCFAQGLAIDVLGLPAGLRLSNAVRLQMGLR